MRSLKHLIPWWLYVGRERRRWMKFKRERQALEVWLFNSFNSVMWDRVREENNLFGVWD